LHPLEITQVLSSIGNFGEVYHAKMKKGTKEIEVAIKMVKNLEDEMDRLDFEREQAIMSTMVHHNVVRLYGLIHDEGTDQPYAVLSILKCYY
jgi:serine/threonine protein kinase